MRSLRLLAALALTVAATFIATPADAADTGDVTVTMLDVDGNPATGLIQIIGTQGYAVQSATGVSSHTFSLDPGTYGVLGLTPWGGLLCAGVESCDYLSIATGHAVLSGDLVVTSGGTVSRTLQSGPPATVGGKHVVGSPLVVDYSDSLDELFTVFATGGLGVQPTVEWLRNGMPIPGATADTYLPTGADSGKDIAARLTYTGIGLAYMQQSTGVTTIPPFTTPPVSVAKKKAQAFIRMVRTTISTQQHAVARVDVTSPNSVVGGKVRIAVADWEVTRSLRNGRATVRLPALRPGKYDVTAAYLGSSEYRPARAKSRQLTVTR